MELNGKTYGTLIDGTFLLRHGNAPRLRPGDKNRMVWVECTRCESFKMVRLASIKAGLTISCGCRGRKEFVDRHEAIASKVAPATRKAVFEALYKQGIHPSRAEVARRFNLSSRYIVDFLTALHRRWLLRAAKLGRKALRLISATESRWIRSWRRRQRSSFKMFLLDAAQREHMYMNDAPRSAFDHVAFEHERTAWAQMKAAGGFMAVLRDAAVQDVEVSLCL